MTSSSYATRRLKIVSYINLLQTTFTAPLLRIKMEKTRNVLIGLVFAFGNKNFITSRLVFGFIEKQAATYFP